MRCATVHLPVRVTHPLTGREVDVGEIRITEVDAIEDLDGPDEETDRFDVGYGMVMGHNERKATPWPTSTSRSIATGDAARSSSWLRRMHAEADCARMWVSLYEDDLRNGVITRTTGYPCLVGGRYVIATTPIPRWDVPRLHRAEHLSLFGAGREKRIYAIPPHTDVEPLTFTDVDFEVEAPAVPCHCGLVGPGPGPGAFLVEAPSDDGSSVWVCSDTDWCRRHREAAMAAPGERAVEVCTGPVEVSP